MTWNDKKACTLSLESHPVTNFVVLSNKDLLKFKTLSFSCKLPSLNNYELLAEFIRIIVWLSFTFKASFFVTTNEELTASKIKNFFQFLTSRPSWREDSLINF